jgi:hypothetical protein
VTIAPRILLLALLAAALLAVAAPRAGAADECRGLLVCLPVAGPWVAIPAPAPGRATSTTLYQLRCPLRGYIVAGVDARLSEASIDISFRGENGSPVGPGVTTGPALLFAGTYAGAQRRPTSFRPFIGCVPTQGGGGRAQTVHSQARMPAAVRPGQPLERVVVSVRLGQSAARSATARCTRGGRLVDASHAIGFFMPRVPSASVLSAVRVVQTVSGGAVTARAAAGAAVPSGVRVELQVHALCAGGGR